MNADFILAIGELGKEKGIDPELLFQAVEEALVTAYKKNFGSNQNVRVDMNKVTGELHIYAQRHIVAEVGDDPNEISLAGSAVLCPLALPAPAPVCPDQRHRLGYPGYAADPPAYHHFLRSRHLVRHKSVERLPGWAHDRLLHRLYHQLRLLFLRDLPGRH